METLAREAENKARFTAGDFSGLGGRLLEWGSKETGPWGSVTTMKDNAGAYNHHCLPKDCNHANWVNPFCNEG